MTNIDTAALPGPEWLPGLPPDYDPENRLDGATGAGATFRVPQLTELDAAVVADAVRTAALAARGTHRVADVVTGVARAARRLADSSDPVGRQAIEAVRAATGCGPGAAGDILRRNAAGWTGPVLSALIRSELGELAVLDEPRPDADRPGRRRRAAGPPILHLVLAGNVPGVAVTAVIRALVVRSGVLCKLPASEPWLVGLFARALNDTEPALAATIAATWWPTDTPGPVAHEWTKRSNQVVVYGGAEAARAIRHQTPVTVSLLEYGPRTGAVIMGPHVTDDELSGLARDTCAYGQAGCVSPRLVYVLGDRGTSPADAVVERLGRALSATAGEQVAFLTDAEAVAVRAARARCQFGEVEGLRASGPDDLSWTILYHPVAGARSEALPRVLWVYALPAVAELRRFRGVLEGRLQALGLAGLSPEDRLAAEQLAVEFGISRVTRLGAMAWPPPDWRHDGRHQLLPLVRWTEFETTDG